MRLRITVIAILVICRHRDHCRFSFYRETTLDGLDYDYHNLVHASACIWFLLSFLVLFLFKNISVAPTRVTIYSAPIFRTERPSERFLTLRIASHCQEHRKAAGWVSRFVGTQPDIRRIKGKRLSVFERAWPALPERQKNEPIPVEWSKLLSRVHRSGHFPVFPMVERKPVYRNSDRSDVALLKKQSVRLNGT